MDCVVKEEDIIKLHNRIYFFMQDCGINSKNCPMWKEELKDIFMEELRLSVDKDLDDSED